jgi:hypothetical protein
MSTDRTIQPFPTTTVRPLPQTNSKPIVNFNIGGNTKTICSDSVPGFGVYLSNSHQSSFSHNYISSSNNLGKFLLIKDLNIQGFFKTEPIHF